MGEGETEGNPLREEDRKRVSCGRRRVQGEFKRVEPSLAPALILMAVSMARPIVSVWTDAARPYLSLWPDHAMSQRDRTRSHTRARGGRLEAVPRVVCEGDSLCRRSERLDGENRAENLLHDKPGSRAHVPHEGGRNEEPLLVDADHLGLVELRALLVACKLNILLDASVPDAKYRWVQLGSVPMLAVLMVCNLTALHQRWRPCQCTCPTNCLRGGCLSYVSAWRVAPL